MSLGILQLSLPFSVIRDSKGITEFLAITFKANQNILPKLAITAVRAIAAFMTISTAIINNIYNMTTLMFKPSH